MDIVISKLKFENNNNNRKYKIGAIFNSAVRAKKSESGHILGLYNLVSWKDYPKEENTWKPALTVQHLWKLLSIFHKKHQKKLMATLMPINSASPITKLILKFFLKPSVAKYKWGWLARASSFNKCSKKDWVSVSYKFQVVQNLFLVFPSKSWEVFLPIYLVLSH